MTTRLILTATEALLLGAELKAISDTKNLDLVEITIAGNVIQATPISREPINATMVTGDPEATYLEPQPTDNAIN